MIHHLMFLIFAYSNQIGNSQYSGEWTDATWDEYPFMVRMSGSQCNGAILSLNDDNGKGVVLTSAWCVSGNGKGVKVGPANEATTYNIESWTIHENFVNEYPWANDIALIYLTQAITHPGAEQVVLQHNDNLIRENDEVLITQYGSEYTDPLEVAFTHTDTCSIDTLPGFICISDHGGMDNMESSVCQGRMGSPLIHNGKQIGMVSSVGMLTCYGQPQPVVN
eukprot:323051_1